MGGFAEALRCFEAGLLADARRKCIALLRIEPGHGEGLHMLGVLEHRAGRLNSAVTYLAEAAVIYSKEASYHFNYGVVLCDLRSFRKQRKHFPVRWS